MIGLRSGDIGDYSQPSERLYTQIFNQTGLQTLVYTRYIPTKDNQMILNSDESANVPFYRRSGPFFGVKKQIYINISFLFILFLSSIGGLF